MVTKIKYKRQAAGTRNVMAAFEFTYVDESGETQTETVQITEEGAAVPTTSFPTYQPSHTPTATPSSLPTNVFSGQPTNGFSE